MLIFKTDALWNGKSWDHSRDRKMARRVDHVREIRPRKATEETA